MHTTDEPDPLDNPDEPTWQPFVADLNTASDVTMHVRLLGYFPCSPALIHPSELIVPGWLGKERALIVGYLRRGVRVNLGNLGYDYCLFADGPSGAEMGRCEMIDGAWYWPEGLHHYVDRYHVRLPDEFVEHVRANNYVVPDLGPPGVFDVDGDWWISWCRANRRPWWWRLWRRLTDRNAWGW